MRLLTILAYGDEAAIGRTISGPHQIMPIFWFSMMDQKTGPKKGVL